MLNMLPIGTVVTIGSDDRKLMICGRIQMRGDEEGIYDYSGCEYPEGFQGAAEMYFFNQQDIGVVYAMGFQDQEEFDFREKAQRKLEAYLQKRAEQEQ